MRHQPFDPVRAASWHGASIHDRGVPVEAVASLGTLFSTPLAPGYIPAFVRRAGSADVVIHHAPLPLNDAAILLGLPDDVALIVYWHAEIVGYALLKRLVSPLIRRVLARADRIVVSGQPMIDNSEFLRPHTEKCIVIPYGMDLDYWRTLDASERDGVGKSGASGHATSWRSGASLVIRVTTC